MSTNLILTIIIFILIGIILVLLFLPKNFIEKFETYSYGPYNYMDTGADPLTFYKYPVYREPYMYPYKFYSSYPYPYMTYNNVNI
jgi:hypothetical protein